MRKREIRPWDELVEGDVFRVWLRLDVSMSWGEAVFVEGRE